MWSFPGSSNMYLSCLPHLYTSKAASESKERAVFLSLLDPKYWLNYCSSVRSYVVLVRPKESGIECPFIFKIEDQVLALLGI